MNISLKVDHVIEMSFLGVFWSSFMQNVGAWLMMFGECSTRCHLKNVVSWNVVVEGCAMHGSGKEALKH
jgi:hypothetical protein